MDIIVESYRLHEMAWKPGADYKNYLNQALLLLQTAYGDGDCRQLVINNLAAVLLNLHRNKEALDLLNQYQPECSTYCLNFAIAIAKTVYDINEIHKWNMAETIPMWKMQ